MLRILLACAALTLTLGLGGTVAPLWADSWAMPQVAQFTSPNGQFRLTVTPARIGSQLEHFRDLVAEEEGRKAPPETSAMGMLERRQPDGSWQVQWLSSLRNRVAPVSALVSDDGQRVVTFDDWHGVGTGENVVAIYDAKGAVVKVYTLAEMLPDFYIAALSRSVSSIRWSGEHRMDLARGVLVLSIAVPRSSLAGIENDAERAQLIANEMRRAGKSLVIGDLTLDIALSDGALSPPSGPIWETAFGMARQINAEDAASVVEQARYLTEPLVAPRENTEVEWHGYLREAFYRLTPDYLQGPVPATTVLRSPDAPDYKASESWVLESFTEEAEFAGDGITLATLGPPDNLVRMLRKASSAVPAGSMANSTVYVAIPASHRDAAATAIARTGARFVWLNTESAIPQRPERIPGSPEEAAANETIQRNMSRSAADAARDAADAARGAEEDARKAKDAAREAERLAD